MITAVSLGSYNLIQPNWLLQNHKNASFPTTVYSRSQHSNKNGNTITNPTFASYPVVMDFLIVGTSFSDLAIQRDLFLAIIGRVHAYGEQQLVITRSDGSMRWLDIKAVVVGGDLSVDDVLSCSIEVTFEAEYPFFQGLNQNIQSVSLANGGGMAVPMPIPINMSNDSLVPVAIENGGNYPAYPIFTFVGGLTNPIIENIETGQSFSLSLTLTLGQSVVVDTFFGSVVQEPSGNVGRQYATGTFWTVPVGNSTVQLTTSNGSDLGYCVLSWYDTFLNI